MTTLARRLLVATAVAGLATPMAAGVAPAAACDGGAQEQISANTSNAQASTASAAFVPIPSALLNGGFSGAPGVPGDFDSYTVTFSGEAGNGGGGSWEIKAQVAVDGGAYVDMAPAESNTFHSGNPRATHTMTWCARLEVPSGALIRVVWRKVGGGTAIVDGYLFQVQRSD